MTEVLGVFQGGGVRGTALVGAVAAVEEMKFEFKAVAGTSAGAIVASLIASGYSASEMRTLLIDKDFNDFKDSISHVPFLKWLKIFYRLGLHKGDAFQRWIGEKISIKLTDYDDRSPTFKDLPMPLTVVAADVIRQRPLIFNQRNYADLPVADAVRMSMTIPLFFCPVKFANSLVVDGGLLSNFPAWAFEEETTANPLPVLGFRLQPDDIPQHPNLGPYSFIKSLIDTVIRASPELQNTHVPNLHLIDIPTLGISATQFDITQKDKIDLYNAGYSNAKAYIQTNLLL